MPVTTEKRRNRVFKSLHKPLTYMGIERTLFFMIAVSAVANSLQHCGRGGSLATWCERRCISYSCRREVRF